MNEEKNDDNGNERVSFPSVPKKWGCWYFGFGSVLGICAVFAIIFKKWDKDWFEILGLTGSNLVAVAAILTLLFTTRESVVNVKQRCAKRRKARNREIAEKIKWEVEGRGRNPQSFNDELKNQAFRLLEKHRPPFFSRICRRKSSEYNKMIAREILCAMRINLRGDLNNFDDELEKRAFLALEKYR